MGQAQRLRTGWIVLAALTAAGLGWPARGDTVVLKNGDQLTGTIMSIEPTTVRIKSPILGELAVPRDGIKRLQSQEKVRFIDASGAAHEAYVGPGTEAAAFTEAAAIPPAAATEPAKETPLNLEPYFLPVGPHWKNQLAVGLLNTTGNTESTQYTGEADFHYNTAPWEINMKIGGAYGVTDDTRNMELAFFDVLARRDLPELHTHRWFLFAESHELYDGIKGITFRSIDNAGVGHYIWKGQRLNMDLRSGPGVTYVRHFTEGEGIDFTGLVGFRATYKINDRLSLSEDLLYTNALTHTDRFQAVSETALHLKLPELGRGFGLKGSFQDDYDSTAPAGRAKNDTRLVLALTLDF